MDYIFQDHGDPSVIIRKKKKKKKKVVERLN